MKRISTIATLLVFGLFAATTASAHAGGKGNSHHSSNHNASSHGSNKDSGSKERGHKDRDDKDHFNKDRGDKDCDDKDCRDRDNYGGDRCGDGSMKPKPPVNTIHPIVYQPPRNTIHPIVKNPINNTIHPIVNHPINNTIHPIVNHPINNTIHPIINKGTGTIPTLGTGFSGFAGAVGHDVGWHGHHDETVPVPRRLPHELVQVRVHRPPSTSPDVSTDKSTLDVTGRQEGQVYYGGRGDSYWLNTCRQMGEDMATGTDDSAGEGRGGVLDDGFVLVAEAARFGRGAECDS